MEFERKGWVVVQEVEDEEAAAALMAEVEGEIDNVLAERFGASRVTFSFEGALERNDD